MSIINPKTKEQIIKYIQDLKDEENRLKDIQKSVEDIFSATLSLKTISMYQKEADREEWINRLKKQNEQMNEWLKNTEPRTFVNKTELIAEGIYNAVKNSDNSLFDELFKNK